MKVSQTKGAMPNGGIGIRRYWLIAFTAVLALCVTGLLGSLRQFGSVFASSGVELEQSGKATVLETYSQLPLAFEANQGQIDPEVKLLSRGRGYTLFLTSTEAVLVLRQQAAGNRQRAAGRGQQAGGSRQSREGRGGWLRTRNSKLETRNHGAHEARWRQSWATDGA